LRRYGAFSAQHDFHFKWMLRAQRLIPRVPPRLLAAALQPVATRRFTHWSFGHYLKIAHPSFAHAASADGVPAPGAERLIAA
jgi:digeranylgeranylglycerophospholipid reductase